MSPHITFPPPKLNTLQGMSPRFQRYLRRSLLPLALFALLVMLLKFIAIKYKIEWLNASPFGAFGAVVAVFYLKWLTRANPQDSN